MMTRSTLDLWVGLFVTIGLVALLFLSLKVSNLTTLNTGGTYQVRARFDNIGGLKVRGPVKSAGVVVGRVSEIRFDNESFQAEVVMNIENRYRFPLDTSAKILTTGLLGDQFIGLTAGGDTTDLKNGDALKITQSAIVLENLIGQFLFSKAADGGGDKK